MRLADRPVRSIMTPRVDVVWLDLSDSQEDIRKSIVESVRSRFPVGRDEIDAIEGIVHAKDLLDRMIAGQPFDLTACMRQPLFVHEGTPVLKLLESSAAPPCTWRSSWTNTAASKASSRLRISSRLSPANSWRMKQERVGGRSPRRWLMADRRRHRHRSAGTPPRQARPQVERRLSHAGRVLFSGNSGIFRKSASASTGRTCASRSSIWTAAASTAC